MDLVENNEDHKTKNKTKIRVDIEFPVGKLGLKDLLNELKKREQYLQGR
ncbi:MAG: hypothetical protein ACTSVC_00775 [Promethearchaeota archaeon]